MTDITIRRGKAAGTARPTRLELHARARRADLVARTCDTLAVLAGGAAIFLFFQREPVWASAAVVVTVLAYVGGDNFNHSARLSRAAARNVSRPHQTRPRPSKRVTTRIDLPNTRKP